MAIGKDDFVGASAASVQGQTTTGGSQHSQHQPTLLGSCRSSHVVVGFGIHNGVGRTYLLTPVPEPETYALMLSGLGLLALGRRWRRAR